MKYCPALAALTLIVGFTASNASADSLAATLAQRIATKVTGTITLPALPQGLANFQCNDVVVTAFSNDLVVPISGQGPGWYKWTRTVKATGTISSGRCTYTMRVPANSGFTLRLTGDIASYPCDYIDLAHAASGTVTVPLGSTKTKNMSVSSYTCGAIN